MANCEGRKCKGFEVTVDLSTARKGMDIVRYVGNLNELLRSSIRRNKKFPEARFDSSRRKESVLLIYNVPEDVLRAELDRYTAQARDHGYYFTYELNACEGTLEEAESNEIMEYDALLAEKDDEITLLRKRLGEGEAERDELSGRLKMAKLDKTEAKPSIETVTRTIEVYPLKASMKTLRGYSKELDLLDSFLKPFEGEVSAETAIEIAGLPFPDFVRKLYGDGPAEKAAEMDRNIFYDVERSLTKQEREMLIKAPLLQLSALNYKEFIKLVRISDSEMPCVLTPKNSSKLALYIPKGKSSKGPASKALHSTVLDALENSGLKVESEKHDFVRELQFLSDGDRKEFARSLSDELELEVNKLLPEKIGYKIYVANFLEE